MLKYVPDRFKTKKICDKAAGHDPFSLQYASDWFVTQQKLKIWHDDDDYCSDDEIIKWHDGYVKHKGFFMYIKFNLNLTLRA